MRARARSARPASPAFFEFRRDADARALRGDLRAFDPDVAIVFRPEIIPAGALHGLRARTVGFLTEPLPAAWTARPCTRTSSAGCGSCATSTRRTSTASSPSTRTSRRPPTRSCPSGARCRCPSPTATSRRFRCRRPARTRRGRCSSGARRRTARRCWPTPSTTPTSCTWPSAWTPTSSQEALETHDVGINLHNDPYPSFENRVCLHLAAGHLVLSEWLHPAHGLEPGLDFVVTQTPGELLHALLSLRRFPAMWHRVRVRGRRKAEQFRASRVYPRLLHDLFADLAAFGTARAA